MRIGKKLKSGLRLGAKIGAGALAVAGGLFALGSKASPSVGMDDVDRVTDFMSGGGSIANVPTRDLDKLYPNASQGMGGTNPLPPRPPVISTAQPRQQSTQSIINRRVNDVPAGFIPPPTGPARIIN